ncbi:BadF/BadG/BcrA/BcrD ATPase family protein [Saccharomonospora sp. NPDC046836]|uniref:N-acetylglucosamine kinase n=1 Tax=Saccharomonospora sp. NPDC046836 TaxID=3156921 RepID=UPI00340925E2
MSYVVGVDAGGTATRAMAMAADGTQLGAGLAGGANPNSVPPEEAAGAMTAAIAAALDGLDPAGLRACVVGMAGTSKLTDPAIAEMFERAWRRAGLPVTPEVVSDAVTAFAAATPEPDGTVLIAGTGSIAGRIRGRRMVAVAGGYGWLLGDEGSGFWIGREAVRAALDVLSRGGQPGPLAGSVLAEAGVDPGEPRAFHRLIAAANGDLPVRLARFAPLVSTAAVAGDPVACAIVEDAARLLVDTALAAREPGERSPVVLVGSVLGQGSPVGRRVRAGLAGLDVLASSDGVLGAAWLAAVAAFGEHVSHPKRVP